MRAMYAAMMLVRLPVGITGLALVLFLRAETGSFAVAGAAVGGMALGAGVGAPVGARLVDAHGARVLLALAGAHAAGLGCVVALGYAPAPAGVLVGATFLTGVALPPASSVMRALFPRLLAGDAALIQSAYALDSVLTETIFVAGPLITAVLVALVAPAAALGISALAVVTGAALFLAALPPGDPARLPSSTPVPDRFGALRAPGIRTLIGAMLPVGFALGSLEVALPAFAQDRGRPELAGVLIAFWSVGSVAGGLVYGARARRRSLGQVHLLVALLLPLGFLPLALAGSVVAMAILVVPAGVLIAPLLATRNELAAAVAPAGSRTEAITWPLTAMIAGVSLGAAAAGGLVEASGWRLAIVVGAAAAGVGAAVALARRRTLEPAAAVAA
ncbi:MAG: hypothetical protein QOJ07_1581 [Thermoleophilaceae bacterium]|jgi:MFS family permease|nr:hypothetical protein [Thermoleophilaceae bacterium]